MCILLFWVECAINVNLILLLHGVAEFYWFSVPFYQLREECQSCQLKLWIGFVYFSFHFYPFCFTYFAVLLFWTYTFKIAMPSWWIDSYHYLISHSVPGNLLCFNVYFINIATPAFFWLLFLWCIISHPFIFNLPILLHLKWISCL